MDTKNMFWQITWRAMAGFWVGAWLVQALTMALFAWTGVFAASVNPEPVSGLQALLGVFFLALVGGVASGLISLPIGLFVGCTGGLLLSLVTRLFFHPPAAGARYRLWSGVLLGGYGALAGWLTFMGLVLFLSRDHTLHDPALLGWGWGIAGVVGLCGVLVAQWIARWYARAGF